MSRLFADISKASVEPEPGLLEGVRWHKPLIRTDHIGETHADSGIVERSVSRYSTSLQYGRCIFTKPDCVVQQFMLEESLAAVG